MSTAVYAIQNGSPHPTMVPPGHSGPATVGRWFVFPPFDSIQGSIHVILANVSSQRLAPELPCSHNQL